MKRRTSRRFQPTMTPGLDQLESRQLLSSGFQVVTSPTVTGADLSAVSAVSPTDIWAVGSDSTGPLIENFNGTSWSVVAAPAVSGGTLSGVSALSKNAAWAVGSNGSGAAAGRILQRHILEHPDDADNRGGSSHAQRGDRHLFHRRLGRGRRQLRRPHRELQRHDLEHRHVPVNNQHQSFLERHFGHLEHRHLRRRLGPQIVGSTSAIQRYGVDRATTQISGSDATRAVDAISATDVWVVGDAGLWNFNGTSWSQFADPNVFVNAVSSSSSNNVFAVGNTPPAAGDETTFVDQWNGTSWSPVTSANPGNEANSLDGVTTLSNGFVVAVGTASTTTSNTTTSNALIESATFSVSPVTPIATTTALTFTPSSPSFGTSVTFTATITPASTGSAAPTGTVAFLSGSTLLGGGTVSNDVATFTTTALPVGTSSITATYGGDSNYDASTSPAVTVTTTPATTSTTVSFSPASPVLGQDVTLMAAIAPASTGPASPTGTVEFFDGSTLLGSGTVSNDAATLTTTALSLGANTITATYEGDSNYVGSTSPAITVTVVQTGAPPRPPSRS